LESQLRGLELPTYLYPEEDQTALKARHSAGALVKIRGGKKRIDWQRIVKRSSAQEPGAYPVTVHGIFSSSQQALLSKLARRGFLGSTKLYPNPLAVYQKYLKETTLPQLRGIIHGDLHWRNILIENGERGPSTWLIDYGRTGLGPIVFDAIQLETDLLINVFPDLASSRGWQFDSQQVLRILAQVARWPNRAVIGTSKLTEKKIETTTSDIIRMIRFQIREFLPTRGGDRDWRSYYIGMCLYALGFLRYLENEGEDAKEKEMTNRRCRICLAIAASAAELLEK
jgi:hypothetical protein